MVKAQTIIDDLSNRIKNKLPISPGEFIEASYKLNLLISDEQEVLFNWQQIVAQKKAELISNGDSVAKAKIMIEASEEYKQYCIQKARIEQIIEFVRIAKIQSRISQSEFSGY